MILRYPAPELMMPTIRWDFNQKNSDYMLVNIACDLVREAPLVGWAAVAANQTGMPHRLFILEHSLAEMNNLPPLIINPTLFTGGFVESQGEGCLSFPGVEVPVRRFTEVECIFQNISGKHQSVRLHHLIARIFQHECEHLDGKTFLDRMTPEEQREVLEKNARTP